jgi:hypothetical protein
MGVGCACESSASAVATTISVPSDSITSDFIPQVRPIAKYCRIYCLTARHRASWEARVRRTKGLCLFGEGNRDQAGLLSGAAACTWRCRRPKNRPPKVIAGIAIRFIVRYLFRVNGPSNGPSFVVRTAYVVNGPQPCPVPRRSTLCFAGPLPLGSEPYSGSRSAVSSRLSAAAFQLIPKCRRRDLGRELDVAVTRC